MLCLFNHALYQPSLTSCQSFRCYIGSVSIEVYIDKEMSVSINYLIVITNKTENQMCLCVCHT